MHHDPPEGRIVLLDLRLGVEVWEHDGVVVAVRELGWPEEESG